MCLYVCISKKHINQSINYYIKFKLTLLQFRKMTSIPSSTKTNTKQTSSKKVAKRAPRQKASIHKLLFNEFEVLSKHAIGDAGEEFICNTIQCESCGRITWTNLNKKQMTQIHQIIRILMQQC